MKHPTKPSAYRWLALYYPKTAEALFKRAGADRIPLLQHGLKKWRGLRPKVLQRYGLRAVGREIRNDSGDVVLEIDGESCALCCAFLYETGCRDCPLAKVRGGTPCSCETDSEDLTPYDSFTQHKDPGPMIKLLSKALRLEKRVKS